MGYHCIVEAAARLAKESPENFVARLEHDGSSTFPDSDVVRTHHMQEIIDGLLDRGVALCPIELAPTAIVSPSSRERFVIYFGDGTVSANFERFKKYLTHREGIITGMRGPIGHAVFYCNGLCFDSGGKWKLWSQESIFEPSIFWMKVPKWRPVIDYEGFYEVGDNGQVRSLNRVVKHGRAGYLSLEGKVLKQQKIKSGYMMVSLMRDGKQDNRTVHSIVLSSWVSPRPEGLEGCHNDGDSSNNFLANLRWDTHESNMKDTREHGTHNGTKVKRSDGEEFVSVREAAEKTFCSASHISAVCLGKRKSAGGYGWEHV